MEILCTLKNLNLAFGPKVIFSNAGLTISEGDKIGLLGLNGHGKSTFFKVLTEEMSADSSTPPFTYDRANRISSTSRPFSVFRVPQEFQVFSGDSTIRNYIFNYYPKLNAIHKELDLVEKQLEITTDGYETLVKRQQELFEEFEHIEGWDTIRNYESYLSFFGLTNLDDETTTLSGGEQKRVLLALGLSTPYPLVLWDEPTNHLDMETIKQFEDELRQSPKTYLIITHDRYLLSSITSKIVHIGQGNIKRFDGSYTDYLEHLKTEESERAQLTLRLKNRLRREDAWMKQGIKARGTRSKKRVEGFHGLKDKIGKLVEQTRKELTLSIHKSNRKTKILSRIKELSFSYNNNDFLINNFSVEIAKGDKIGILGPNGAGKTTILALLAGDLQPTKGEISSTEGLRIGMFTQKRTELDNSKTPFQILGDGADHVSLPENRTMHVTAYFEKFLFNRDEINRPLNTFSGGERNRLQMALNLAKSADLWIFDEPTNDLDLESLAILESHLAKFNGSLIVVSHDRAFLSSVTNKIWLLSDGEIEKFDAGYSQVEPYLEAFSMNQKMLAELGTKVEEDIPTPIVTKTKKLSNKEKERLKVIPKIIRESEKKLELIDSEISSFDFSSSIPTERNGFQDLSEKKEELELELLELYEELEGLE